METLASIINESNFLKQQALIFHFFVILRSNSLPVMSIEFLKTNKRIEECMEDLPDILDDAVQLNEFEEQGLLKSSPFYMFYYALFENAASNVNSVAL